jgi:hypothetical protein
MTGQNTTRTVNSAEERDGLVLENPEMTFKSPALNEAAVDSSSSDEED